MRLPRPNRAGGTDLILSGANSNHRNRDQYESINDYADSYDNGVTSVSCNRTTPIITTACISDSEDNQDDDYAQDNASAKKEEQWKASKEENCVDKKIKIIAQGHPLVKITQRQSLSTSETPPLLLPKKDSIANIMSSTALSIADDTNINNTSFNTNITTAVTPNTSGVRFPLAPRYRWRDLILGDFSFTDDGER